jgi:hypothetical protein
VYARGWMFTIQRISVRRLPEAPFSSKILIIDDVRIQLALSKISTLPSSTSGVAPQLAEPLCSARHPTFGLWKPSEQPSTPHHARSAHSYRCRLGEPEMLCIRISSMPELTGYPASEAARNSKGSEAWPGWNWWGLKGELGAAGCGVLHFQRSCTLSRSIAPD